MPNHLSLWVDGFVILVYFVGIVAIGLYPLAGACAGLWLGADQTWAIVPGAVLLAGSAGFAFAGLVLERREWDEVGTFSYQPWVAPTDGGFIAGVSWRR